MVNRPIHKMKVVLAVVFATAATFVFGQSYTITPNDSIADIAPFNDLTHFTIQQNNSTGNGMILSWQQISVSVPVGWTAFLCDNGSCFTNFPLNGTMDTVGVGEYGLLSVGIDPVNIPGTALIRYSVWDVNTPNQKDTLTWIITANGSTFISKTEDLNSFTVFPTIADNQVTLQTNCETLKLYLIFDAAGKIVSSGSILAVQTMISVQNLPNGVYFISMTDSKRNQSIRKVVVKH